MTIKEINKAFTTKNGNYRNGIMNVIAERADVSQQTVYNVLRERKIAYVSINTRKKVIEAAIAHYNEIKEWL